MVWALTNFFQDLLVDWVLGPAGFGWVILVISPRMAGDPWLGGWLSKLIGVEDILASKPPSWVVIWQVFCFRV